MTGTQAGAESEVEVEKLREDVYEVQAWTGGSRIEGQLWGQQ